ncbi:hypothetical protein JVW08_20600, partial [Vibrio cholerae O1]|uniref:hypothetical protein n=1 Tax=Vibrio cholerae TaxID=666 RepID=UPI001C119EB1
MKKGVQFGESFAEGQTGFGGKIDGDGATHVDVFQVSGIAVHFQAKDGKVGQVAKLCSYVAFT